MQAASLPSSYFPVPLLDLAAPAATQDHIEAF
jgi:hypothetical protein